MSACSPRVAVHRLALSQWICICCQRNSVLIRDGDAEREDELFILRVAMIEVEAAPAGRFPRLSGSEQTAAPLRLPCRNARHHFRHPFHCNIKQRINLSERRNSSSSSSFRKLGQS